MKTIEQILSQEPVYLNDWSENKKIGVIGDFEDIYISKSEYEAESCPYANTEAWLKKKEKMKNSIEKWSDINILFASYGCANYEGDAFVLFEKEGKLYEASGSHCSCYGLEGQFNPTETTIEELAFRLKNGSFGKDDYSGSEFHNELCQFIGVND